MSLQVPPPDDREVRRLAKQFRYPPTPDLVGTRQRAFGRARPGGRRLLWAAALLGLALLVAFSVPSVRAGILDFFQIGAVRIFPTSPAGTPRPTLTAAPPVPGLFDLAGETTLESAREQIPFPILLPSYPPDLGEPDRVYVQMDGPMVILVWLDPSGKAPALSLHEIAPGSITLTKMEPHVIQETQVNGDYAVWATGVYVLELRNGDRDFRRLVNGNTLIWRAGEITYRLETQLPLEQALKIAESLH